MTSTIDEVMLKDGAYACFDCVKAADHSSLFWKKAGKTTSGQLRAEIESVSQQRANINNAAREPMQIEMPDTVKKYSAP